MEISPPPAKPTISSVNNNIYIFKKKKPAIAGFFIKVNSKIIRMSYTL